MTADLINNPAHYTHYSIECIDIVRHLPFDLGNAIKYLYRRNHKNQTDADIKKAVFYLKDESERWQKFGAPNRYDKGVIIASNNLDTITKEETDEKVSSTFFWISNALYYGNYKYLNKSVEFISE